MSKLQEFREYARCFTDHVAENPVAAYWCLMGLTFASIAVGGVLGFSIAHKICTLVKASREATTMFPIMAGGLLATAVGLPTSELALRSLGRRHNKIIEARRQTM